MPLYHLHREKVLPGTEEEPLLLQVEEGHGVVTAHTENHLITPQLWGGKQATSFVSKQPNASFKIDSGPPPANVKCLLKPHL